MSNQSKSTKIKQYSLVALGVVLLLLIGWTAGKLYNQYQYIQQEAKTTPSPSPNIASMLSITPDPLAPTPSPTPLLIKNGSQGDEVIQLQSRLKALGFYQGEVDGQFGNGTREAVIRFQQQHLLDADGLVGPSTIEMINSSAAQTAAPTVAPTQEPSVAPSSSPSSDTLTLPANLVSTNNGISLPLLVNRDNPLPDNFEAENLVYLKDACPEELVVIKGSETEGNATAVLALNEMFSAAHEDGLTQWQISAGYRSISYQKTLFDNKVAEYRKEGFSQERAISATQKTVADPGTSEHHTGLAFDITVPGKTFKYTEQSKWLAEHCWDYGFILRYQEGKEDITGILAEPWHIRYVGIEHSLAINAGNLALEEYINENTSSIVFID